MLPVIVRMTTDDERVGEPKLPSLQTSLYVYRWQSNRAASAPSLYSPGPHLSLTYTPLLLLETDSSLFTRTHLSLTYSSLSSGPNLSLTDSSTLYLTYHRKTPFFPLDLTYHWKTPLLLLDLIYCLQTSLFSLDLTYHLQTSLFHMDLNHWQTPLFLAPIGC